MPTGYLTIEVIQAKLTRNTQLIGKMDPYVLIQLGHYKQKTKTIKEGGKQVKWNQKLKFELSDYSQKMKLTVFDDDGGKDDIVGHALIDIDPYVKQANKVHPMDVYIQYKDKQSGQVKIALYFQPMYLGEMFVKVESANFIKDMDTFSKQDPYIKLIYGKQTRKTTTKKKGGKECQWNQVLAFKVLNLYQKLQIQAYDDDGGNDDFLGSGDIQFQAMGAKKHVDLKIVDKKGANAGVVRIQLFFQS